jgi:excisionase family DNA binding protein
LLSQAQRLLRRGEGALRQVAAINRLAEQRQQLEQTILSQVHPREVAERLDAQRARLEARIQRLCRPIGRLRTDLAGFQADLRAALARWTCKDTERERLRAELGALHWPSAVGFREPLLEPAVANLGRIVQGLKVLLEDRPQPSVEPTLGEVLTLRQAAEYLKVSYQRAAELVRRGMLPAFRLGRQVRLYRRDLEEFMRRGGTRS